MKLLTKNIRIEKATPESAGYDLPLSEDTTIMADSTMLFKTGVHMKIPRNHFALLVGRSSTIFKKKVVVNLGIIDADYLGEIKISVTNPNNYNIFFPKDSYIAQLVIIPIPYLTCYPLSDEKWEEIKTERGIKGFGSTTKKVD